MFGKKWRIDGKLKFSMNEFRTDNLLNMYILYDILYKIVLSESSVNNIYDHLYYFRFLIIWTTLPKKKLFEQLNFILSIPLIKITNKFLK